LPSAEPNLVSRTRELTVKHWKIALPALAAGLLLLAWWAGLGSASADPGWAAAAASAAEPAARVAVPKRSANSPPSPAGATSAALPPRVRYDHIADLTQTDPELDLPGGGDSYCGPVAVSNSLMWLASRGCEQLVPRGDDLKQQQMELVRLLSSYRYMATSPLTGTGAGNLLEGLHRYFVHRGCAYRRLAYQGWRGHPQRFSAGVRPPSLDWLGEALGSGAAAWINVGWYRPSQNGRAYRRDGGHWLTVVAAGVDEQGAADPAMLVLHDPAPYAGTDFADEYVRAEPLESGWLVDGKAALPARGYYRLTGGMHVKREGETAILDGVIVLQL
jgi:hypothetical protein